MLNLQTLNLVGLSATSRFCQPSLYRSFIAHLFQISTIVLFNAIGLNSGHGLIWAINNILVPSIFFMCKFISHLFQTSTIVLSNIIGLRSGYRLIWLFSGSFENLRLVIISATRYSIVHLSTFLCFGLNSNLIWCKTSIYIVCDMSLLFLFFFLSPLVLLSLAYY